MRLIAGKYGIDLVGGGGGGGGGGGALLVSTVEQFLCLWNVNQSG